MADDNGGGSGFLGLIAGLLIAVILIGGGIYFLGGGMDRGPDINVEVPAPSAPG